LRHLQNRQGNTRQGGAVRRWRVAGVWNRFQEQGPENSEVKPSRLLHIPVTSPAYPRTTGDARHHLGQDRDQAKQDVHDLLPRPKPLQDPLSFRRPCAAGLCPPPRRLIPFSPRTRP
jgi:hypothetical protein